VEPVPDKKPEFMATATPEVDFALVLARVIDAVKPRPGGVAPGHLRAGANQIAARGLAAEPPDGHRADAPSDQGAGNRH